MESLPSQFNQALPNPSDDATTEQQKPLSATPKVICGPLLRYIGIDYVARVYYGSCLIVSSHTTAPTLQLVCQSISSGETYTVEARAELLDTFRHTYYFWRYALELPLLQDSEQMVTYSSNAFPERHCFYLPPLEESMRFMFYSCNGFSDIDQSIKDKLGEKTSPLWVDVLDRHAVMPFHVMLGGGDQLYQDRLTKEDFMKPWIEEKVPKVRLSMELSTAMREGLEYFYFWNYVENFGREGMPVVAEAMASIPSVNMWDDHDIIDGFGSYPADMQRSNCFKVLFANACRFYYLFQQHTTIERAPQHGMLRGHLSTCNHIVTTLGADLGLLALDCRGERTKFDVCHKESYDTVLRAMYACPPTVKHFLVLTGVPLIYPRLGTFEYAMESVASFNLATLVGKTGAFGSVISGSLNKWNGDPELLDDMNDHWTAKNHEAERKQLIQRLQLFARDRSIRITFLGGDVHCCGSGRLFSKDMRQKEEADPYLMVQIISSAIVNVPPPLALLTVLNKNSTYEIFNENVEERMYNMFKKSPNGNSRQNTKLMGMRNYCAAYYDPSLGTLNLWIQAEKEAGVKGTMGYLVEVPRLIFGEAGRQLYSRDNRELLQNWTPGPHMLGILPGLPPNESRTNENGHDRPMHHHHFHHYHHQDHHLEGNSHPKGDFVIPSNHNT